MSHLGGLYLFGISRGAVAELWFFDHQASGQSHRPDRDRLRVPHLLKELNMVSKNKKVDLIETTDGKIAGWNAKTKIRNFSNNRSLIFISITTIYIQQWLILLIRKSSY
jgi:hypothetical protein